MPVVVFYVPILIGALTLGVLSVLTCLEVWGSADAARAAALHLGLLLGLPAVGFLYGTATAQGLFANLAGVLAAAAALMLASVLSAVLSLAIRRHARQHRLRQSILGDESYEDHPEVAVFE